MKKCRNSSSVMAQQNPQAIRAAKRLLNQANGTVGNAAAALLQAESDEQTPLIGSRNQQEAVRANLEKRSPRFQD